MRTARFLLTIALIAMSSAGFSQQKDGKLYKGRVVTIEGKEYYVYPEKNCEGCRTPAPTFYGYGLVDGNWVYYYEKDTTRIYSLFSVKNKRLTGRQRDYYYNGQLQFEGWYDDGVDTSYTYWYATGIKEEEGHHKIDERFPATSDDRYRYGLQVGTDYWWYNTGKLCRITPHDADGELNGALTNYYPNGRPKSVENYRHGRLDSTSAAWYANGILRYRIRYSNGAFVNESPYTIYHDNGKPMAAGSLVDATPIGLWTFYHYNGRPKAAGAYDTLRSCYGDDCGNYLMSFPVGKWQYWYANGKLAAQGKYKMSYSEYGEAIFKLDGPWQYWNEHGAPASRNYLIRKNIITFTKSYGITLHDL